MMDDGLNIRDMAEGEEQAVFALVMRGFDELVRVDCTDEGVAEFTRAVDAFVVERQPGHRTIVAGSDGRLLGMIDIRDASHVSLLFVESGARGRGVARALLEWAEERSVAGGTGPVQMTVNSSLWAVSVYERLGFRAAAPPSEANGIAFVPMTKKKRELWVAGVADTPRVRMDERDHARHREFVSEAIAPVEGSFDTASMPSGESGMPRRFRWRGAEYEVARVLETWKTTGDCRHGSGEQYLRKHWFRIETADGIQMEIYFDRQARTKGRKRRWWLATISRPAVDPCTGVNGPVVIVDYDPVWPSQFAELREALAASLGDAAVRIEHVGSTAVPGLAAKPIIDIDVVMGSPSGLSAVVDRLRGLGYEHLGDLGIPGREAFRTPSLLSLGADSPRRIPHHLFAVAEDSPELERHLAHRDALRGDAALAQVYATLKRRLAADLGNDREAYTQAKTEFIEAALARTGRF